LVLAADGQKLSKQNGAQAIDLNALHTEMQNAVRQLGLQVSFTIPYTPLGLTTAIEQWAAMKIEC
jgi:glutamyl-Q tRNA(Asp) synthetase